MKDKIAIVTGGAGFIGSHIVDKLIEEKYYVRVIDSLKDGNLTFLEQHANNPNFKFFKFDLKDKRIYNLFKDVEIVFHFAANADIKGGIKNPTLDLCEGAVVTSNVLEAMRLNNVKKIVFSSTGSVYGEPSIFPTPEIAPFPTQTSFYAASKLYSEALIQSYCEAYNFQSWIYRFVSVLGERYTHGVVFNFVQQLREHPKILNFLSDGTPLKSYLFVGDCIKGIFHGIRYSNNKINLFNLGTDEEITVLGLAEIIIKKLELNDVSYKLGSTDRGWVGDSPHIYLDISKLKGLGWKPEKTIKEAVEITVNYLTINSYFLNKKYFRDK